MNRMRRLPARRRLTTTVGLTGYVPADNDRIVYYRGGPYTPLEFGISDIIAPFKEAVNWVGKRLGMYGQPFFSTTGGKVITGVAAAATVYFGAPYAAKALGALGNAGKSVLTAMANTSTGQWWINAGTSLLRVTKLASGSVMTEDMGAPSESQNPVTAAIQKTVQATQDVVEQVVEAKVKEAIVGQVAAPVAAPLDTGSVIQATGVSGDALSLIPPTPLPLGETAPYSAEVNGGTAPIVVNTKGQDPGKVLKLPDSVNATLEGNKYSVTEAGINPMVALGLLGAAYALYKGKR